MRALNGLQRGFSKGSVVWPLILLAALSGALLTACDGGHDAGHGEGMEAEVVEPEAKTEAPQEAAAANPPLCPTEAPCGDHCTNQSAGFKRLACWPTEYGPAEADVIILGEGEKQTSASNMLYCAQGPYALCFYSGPPDGINGNAPLPCKLSEDETKASCECVVFDSGPFFVDINSILNAGAYYQAVAECGADGSGCANMNNCGTDGSTAGCPVDQQATVCQYVANQNPSDDSVSLIPGADLISTFGFGLSKEYPPGSVDCNGLYAGCMTAPCYAEEGAEGPPSAGDTVRCQCPTYKGDYQIGQGGATCLETSTGYTWSASLTIP